MSTMLKQGARAQRAMSSVLKQGAQIDVELSLPVQKVWDALRSLDRLGLDISANLPNGSLKGNGGVGSVSSMQLPDGRYQKERVDLVDEKTHTLVSTVIAQESPNAVFNQYTRTMAFCPARDGTTTIARWKAECAPPAAGASPVSYAGDEALVFFKALESYLMKV